MLLMYAEKVIDQFVEIDQILVRLVKLGLWLVLCQQSVNLSHWLHRVSLENKLCTVLRFDAFLGDTLQMVLEFFHIRQGIKRLFFVVLASLLGFLGLLRYFLCWKVLLNHLLGLFRHIYVALFCGSKSVS